MRVLILGATGLLGKALVKEWDVEEVLGVGSRDADVRQESQVLALFDRFRPDWTILSAAYTDVDGCEKNPERAHQVNCVGAVNVAQAAREFGSRLMLISSDYVFDGSKPGPYEVDDPIAPLNVYGRSKAAAETILRQILPDACIARTSWLFGVEGRCFPNTILKLAEEQTQLSVVDDQRGCPTFNRDLACAIVKLVRAETQGTIHVANAGECSWFEFAQELLWAAGLFGVSIKSIRTEDLARPAPRPKYSALSLRSLRQLGIFMRSWQEALQDYIRERAGHPSPLREAALPRI